MATAYPTDDLRENKKSVQCLKEEEQSLQVSDNEKAHSSQNLLKNGLKDCLKDLLPKIPRNVVLKNVNSQGKPP
jgi:hypothetical protein